MFTRCPNCDAAFSITGQQLVIAAGMVRCGLCEHVFDARPHLFQEPSSPPESNTVIKQFSEEVEEHPTKEEQTLTEDEQEINLSHDDLDLIIEPVEDEIILEQPPKLEDGAVDGIPNLKAFNKRGQYCIQVIDQFLKILPACEFHIFFGKVEFQFDHGSKMDQFFT